MNKPLILRFKAKKDPSVDAAFKAVNDFTSGTDKDLTKVSAAFERLSRSSKRGADSVQSVAGGAKTAKREVSLLSKGLIDLASQTGKTGRSVSKTGAGLTQAFRVADKGPKKLSASLVNVRDKLRKVGATASSEFKRMKDEAESAADGLAGVGDNVRTPAQLLGNLTQSAAIGTAVTAGFKASLQAATEFEAELRSLNTITGMSDEALKEYGENLRTLSLELNTSTGAAANARAAYDVASAGFVSASENAAVLEATLKAATAGSVEAAEAARLISGSLRAYGADAAEAERFTNVLFATVKSGITTFPELSSSLGNVTGIAAQAGISFEELGAAVATATSRGIRTSQAVDGLRGAISNLLAPSKQAKDEMERLGIVVNEQTLKQKGLLNTLREIANANGGSAESFKKLLGDVQAFGVALALTSDGGKLFAKNAEEIKTNVTALSDAVEEKAQTLQASIDQFKVSLEAAGGAAGEVFLPAAKVLVDGASSILAVFAQLPEPIRDFVTVLGTVAIATGATVKVVKLLATATQLETIQLALNTVAKTANTVVTDANTVAAVKNIAIRAKNAVSLAATTVATNAASLSLAGLTTSLKASAAATGLVGGAFAVVVGALGAGALALHTHTEITKEQTAANEKLLDVELRMAKGQRNYAKLVKLTTAELRDQKVAAEELTDALLANLERQEAAKETGNTALVARLRRENTDLRKKREALAKDEAVDRAVKSKASSIPGSSGDLDEQKKADKEREDRRKELLASELSRIEVLKNRRELSSKEEIQALDKVLQAYELHANERRQIEERVAKLIGEQRAKAEKEDQAATKKRLEDSLKSGTTIPVDVLKNQDGTQDAVNAYDDAIKKVEEWQTKNKALIDQFPELGQKAESALDKLKANRAAAETDRLATNLKNLQAELKQTAAESTNAAEKLASIEDQITKVKREQRVGNISLKDSEEELSRLARERLSTEQTITNQKLRQSGEINELEMEGIRQEIEMLELMKEQGVDVTNELLLKREELYQLRVKRLEDEYQAEKKNADDKIHVEEKYQLERRNLERDHTLDLAKEMKKRLADAASNQKRSNGPSRGAARSEADSSTSGKTQLRLGKISSNPSFFSVDSSPFEFQTEEDKERKVQREAERAAERRRLFERENPQAVLQVQRIEQERARALQDAKLDPTRIKAPFEDKLRAMDPQGVLAKGQAAIDSATDKSGPSTVNNNTTNTVNIYNEQAKSVTAVTEADVIRVVKKEISTKKFYDPNAGL
jgi:TP901 family phage tail tape measure protein